MAFPFRRPPATLENRFVSAVFDNERINTFLLMLEAPEDATSGALVPIYKINAIYFSVVCSVYKYHKLGRNTFLTCIYTNHNTEFLVGFLILKKERAVLIG